MTSRRWAIVDQGRPLELLLPVSRDLPGTLGAQIEDRLRRMIRQGALRAGTRLPSTRELSAQLGVSRRITLEAYAQLGAEGYLLLRAGARPQVADLARPAQGADLARPAQGTDPARPAQGTDPARPAQGTDPARSLQEASPAPVQPGMPLARYDFRPSRPDVSAFPRAAWSRCLREAVAGIDVDDLSYGDAIGVRRLRDGLADYLGRARGVVADPDRVVVTSGYLQGLGLICRTLAARGVRRIALERPSSPEEPLIVERAGLVPVYVEVDEHGLRVDELARADVGAVVLTPAHQHPTGVAMTPERRAAVLAWLRDRDAFAVEDDYDAEYRYDRPAVGALQGLDPDRVVYCGTASKVLAPGLRLGWSVVPARLIAGLRHEKELADQGSPRIEQLAFAYFLERGELDRHLRRMRARYRARRDRMIEAVTAELPDAAVLGIAAGLHVVVRLPEGDDEAAIRRAAEQRQVALHTMADYRPEHAGLPPTLILGYCQTSLDRITAGVHEVAAAVRAARSAQG